MGDIAVGDADLALALDKAAVQAHLEALFVHDFEGAHRAYKKDAVLKRPQFGETFTGRNNIQLARRKHADRELVSIDAVIGQGDLWVAECVFVDDDKKVLAISVMEFCEGQIAIEREYVCDLPSSVHRTAGRGDSDASV